MRLLSLIALLLPLAAHAAIGTDGARLLLERTGFGASPAQVAPLAPLSREAAVDRVLAGVRDTATTPPPAWVEQPQERPPLQGSEEEKQAFRRAQNQRSLELKAWWLREMRDTPSPITEKMTLFWHGHFVSALDKVKSPTLMYRQNLLLRRHALGSFATLLHEVARDPAMMRYLDTNNNRAGQPNENFAREVMELFTLGEGHYGEADIREAARAFTGWGLDPTTQGFVNRGRLHDAGEKTVLGQRGRLDGDDVLDILLRQPQTARFITAKLWRAFVSPTPDTATVNRLADSFRADGYRIRPLLRGLLLTPAFWQSAGSQVKSPLELSVGTLVTLGLHPADWRTLVVVNRQLGQDVFSPPNVKGWPGGDNWINSQTLPLRKALPQRLASAQPPVEADDTAGLRPPLQKALRNARAPRFDADAWLAEAGDTRTLASLLLPLPPADPAVLTLAPRDALPRLLADPAYQLQ